MRPGGVATCFVGLHTAGCSLQRHAVGILQTLNTHCPCGGLGWNPLKEVQSIGVRSVTHIMLRYIEGA